MRISIRSACTGLCPGMALAVLACMAMSPGCGGEHAERQGPERLSVAFESWVGFGPLYLAADKGFFAEEGLALVKRKNGRIPRRPGTCPAQPGRAEQFVGRRCDERRSPRRRA